MCDCELLGQLSTVCIQHAFHSTQERSSNNRVLTSMRCLLLLQRGVEVRSYNVIYDLIDEVTAAMEGLLEPITVKEEIGSATVRAVFGGGSTKIAGCYVEEGKLKKGCTVQVKRGEDKVVFEGTLTSLRRIKDVVKEVSGTRVWMVT